MKKYLLQKIVQEQHTCLQKWSHFHFEKANEKIQLVANAKDIKSN